MTGLTGMSADSAVAHVLATNPAFALNEATIRGVSYRVFENAPPHVAAMLYGSREAQGNGSYEYLVYGDERWTFDDFLNDVSSMAHVLRDTFGVVKGQPVAIAMRNCPELMIMTMAIASVGAVTVFVNAWWTTHELNYALKDSGAKLIFVDGDRADRMVPLIDPLELTLVGVRDADGMTEHSYKSLLKSMDNTTPVDVEIEPDDDFAIMYSSGTTGDPKGVVQTHRGAINAVFTWLLQGASAPFMLEAEPDPNNPAPRQSVLVVTPLFHVTATHPMFLLSIPAGAKVALIYKWDAAEAVRIIRDEKITRFLGVPTQSADLMTAARDMGETLPSLDYVGSGGAKRPASQVAELANLFPNAVVSTGWGMTETNAVGIGMGGQDYEDRPAAAGKPHPPLQDVIFLGDDGTEVAQGEVGEITVKSACNMRCYLNKPEATAEVFQNGWLRTGDLGYIDTDGFITIVDRKKNIIIRGGENIACLDVEGALHRHPGVAEACVFSVPDERLGEIVGAGIQIRLGHETTASDLQSFLTDYIAKFKVPQHIWLQSEPLPRGATDKIDRRALQAICLKDHS
jgi:acyl-CoA synthetase (AMP-forming)/AMP-acid ligase II|tara:strand:+ start:157 stop:1866 length:1710 start_codon:yes stop_codon:yes gene_type:complete